LKRGKWRGRGKGYGKRVEMRGGKGVGREEEGERRRRGGEDGVQQVEKKLW
jgi:hypothetical protein